MDFKITYIDPTTGEPESEIVKEVDCWQKLNSIYSKTIPERKLKPVNIKLETVFDVEE